MEFSLSFIGFCFVTSGIIWKDVEALQCYTCALCNDPFSSAEASITTCAASEHSCVKTKIGSVVARACDTSTSSSCSTTSVLGVETSVCYCTTDKCNGAEAYSAEMFTFIVVIAFLVTLRNLFF